MNNFLTLNDLTNEQIMKLITEALDYKQGNKQLPDLNGTVANIFLEASTRTKTSFELAAKRTGNHVVNMEEKSSALTKGETFQDTLDTLAMLDVRAAVVRTTTEYFYEGIDTTNIKLINAGDGTHEHPSQSLLDLVTIYERFGKFEGLSILIMGDIKHSRVARSNIEAMERLGMTVYVYAPDIFKTDEDFNYITDLEQTLKTVNVVMLLRNQLERHEATTANIQETYLELYGLTEARKELLAKESIIMHPGPFNRDVEIASSVLDDERNKIYEQVKNGLFARVAILNYVLGE
ncbi:aspartate carbamoyltransferase catalytic subunit [Mollicutes bacterium LVI A0078]|nr:aspartate carbamoyltransferase catalytic subunit [Mollicutes bacterium LVI A0075]WOO91190.1 aspartate carbamoyltransferase catalytic subunit [Mollicutes bacterium LVI A0078]